MQQWWNNSTQKTRVGNDWYTFLHIVNASFIWFFRLTLSTYYSVAKLLPLKISLSLLWNHQQLNVEYRALNKFPGRTFSILTWHPTSISWASVWNMHNSWHWGPELWGQVWYTYDYMKAYFMFVASNCVR